MATGPIDKQALAAAEVALESAMKQHGETEARYRRAIAEIVHDIKNPLGAMMGYISLLESQVNGPLGNDKYVEYVKVLDGASERLLGLCQSLLNDYGPKENREDIEEAVKVVDAKALVDEIHKLFGAQAEARGIKLECAIDNKFPDLKADPQDMFRAVSNLVSNAVKFTPKGGTINIQAELEPNSNTFIMVVRDSGVGMTQEQIDAVKKTNHTTVSPHGDVGTGQGLGVVNRVIQGLGGKLDIISTENRGTRMKISLPGAISIKPAPVILH